MAKAALVKAIVQDELETEDLDPAPQAVRQIFEVVGPVNDDGSPAQIHRFTYEIVNPNWKQTITAEEANAESLTGLREGSAMKHNVDLDEVRAQLKDMHAMLAE